MDENRPTGWIDEPLYTRIKQLTPLPTVDLLITYRNKLLLLKRKNPPLQNKWYTPGGRVLLGETLEEAVKRVLLTETGLSSKSIQQKRSLSLVFDGLHAITTLYHIVVNDDKVNLNSDHSEHRWIRELHNGYHRYLREMVQDVDAIKLMGNRIQPAY